MPELQNLSEREIEILRLVAAGKSNKDIAQELYISSNTVKVHLRNIFAKLEVATRTEASMRAVRAGLIASPALPAPETPAHPPPPPAATPTRPQNPLQTLIVGGIVLLIALLGGIAYRLFRPTPGESAASLPAQLTVENSWSEQPSLPAPRTRLAAVVLDQHFYLIGGEVNGAPSADLLRFDPDSAAWETLPAKPTPVSEIQAAVLGGRIYVPGGRRASGEVSAALEVYNPEDAAWSAGAQLPVGLSAYSLAAFEGKLYVFGGWDGSKFVDTVFAYDPDADRWTEKSALPVAAGFSAAAASAGKIYVAGGFDGQSPLAGIHIYSPERDQSGGNPWDAGAPMPQPRYGMSLTGVADKLYLIGGLGSAGGHFSQMEYTPGTDVWQVFENPLAAEWSHFGAAAEGTNIYVYGGEQGGAVTGRALSYQVIFVVVIPVIRE